VFLVGGNDMIIPIAEVTRTIRLREGRAALLDWVISRFAMPAFGLGGAFTPDGDQLARWAKSLRRRR
jgi:hypothetical protein